MLLANAIASALANLAIVAGVPFLGYCGYQRIRHRRAFRDSARRAGLQVGNPRYIGYGIGFAAAAVVLLVAWAPPLAPLLRAGSPQRAFEGLGFDPTAIAMALLYGVVQTGFAEELLFRGLVAGSLARRLPMWAANLAQSLVFLLPHLLLLKLMPEIAALLVAVFAGSLFVGWLRMRSGSILGPWIVHASVNTAMCLYVAVATARHA